MKKQTKCLIALFIIALAVLLAGCQRRRAQSKIQPGDYRESLIVDGRARTYLLHIPSGYTTGISLPLLLAFHGYGGEGENMEELSQFSALADKENFIVVYPDGFEKSWNHGDGSRPAVKENIDDIKFVRMLIEALEKKLPIDSSKIFATGFSNGALMTERLGCELADVLAGIAPVSGSMPKKIAPVCKPAKPIPFHLIYGIADPLSPYSGGALKNKGGEVLSVKDTLAFWAKQNGCLSSKEERLTQQVNDGTSVIKTAYQQCTKADTILYSIEGGGHAWPPSAPGLQHITGKSSKNLDASKVIWEFFKAASKDTMPQDELSPYKAGDYRESIDIDNRQRTYLLHIPSRYDPNKNYPLVLGFHGGGGSGEKFSGQTGFSDYAVHVLDFFDATNVHPTAKGFQLADYDKTGRRVIFYPWGRIIARPHGTVLAYHTDHDFFSKDSYDAVDLTKLLSPDAQGFGTGFVDDASEWAYFVPFRKDIGWGRQGANDLAIRFNLKKQLSDPTAYETFRLNSLPNKPPKLGWVTGAYIDGYAFFVPYGTPITKDPWHLIHGILLRYDARKPFTDTSAWQWYDLQHIHAKATGFQSVAAQSPWLYLIPYYPGNNVLVRYHVTKPFTDPSSYETVDLTSFNPNARGYTGFVMAGHVLVLTPWRDFGNPIVSEQSVSLAAAFDTRKPLSDASGWSFFDLTELHPDAKGYQWGWFDKDGFVHFVPTHNFATRLPPPFVVWDSNKPFTDPGSWAVYSSDGVPASTGAAYDGNYAWLAPYGTSGKPGSSGLITRVTFRPNEPPPPPSSDLPGDHRGSLSVGGRERTYLLHQPGGHNPAKRYPLVLVFHGGGGTGEKAARQTRFNDYADREGFVVVYPDAAVRHNWNDGRGTTDAEKAGIDDVKFVRELIKHLKGKLSIDTNRIYATGPSNGGIFSYRLGCEMADVFAAIGPVIGSMPANIAPKCNPSKPISVVVIQGTEDPFIPIEGGDTKHKKLGIGDGGLVESAEDSMELWAEKNECKGTPKKEKLPVLVNDGTGAERIAYSQCKGESEVAYYIVNGMGHGWPPKGGETRREEVSGPTSHNIDATKVIWEFFKAHAKK